MGARALSAGRDTSQPRAHEEHGKERTDTVAFLPPEDYELPDSAIRRLLSVMLDQAERQAVTEAS